MKKIFAIVCFISALCGLSFAQSRIPELEKVKQIKFLQSTREDVKKILAEYEGKGNAEHFSTANAVIEIDYTGKEECSNDDWRNIWKWNISEGKVESIIIVPFEPFNLKDLISNNPNYRKEQLDDDRKEFIYNNKNLGIVFIATEDKVERIILFPSRSHYSLACDDKKTKEFLNSYSMFEGANLE